MDFGVGKEEESRQRICNLICYKKLSENLVQFKIKLSGKISKFYTK